MLEPQNLQPRRFATSENEERAAFGISAELAPDGLRQAIEAPAHVDSLGTHEDANVGGNHEASITASRRCRAAGSNSGGARTRRPLPRSSSKRASVAAALISSSDKGPVAATARRGARRSGELGGGVSSTSASPRFSLLRRHFH